MGSVTTLARDTTFTRDELDALPDDGRRHELVDGVLVVSPAPSRRHQRVLARLHVALVAVVDPATTEMLFAPFDVVLAPDTIVQPDLLIAPVEAFTERDLPGPPQLAVEVLSPSTRRFDLHLKHARYAAAGIPFYWVVDPTEPSITAYRLGTDGTYEVAAHAVGDEELTIEEPVEITLVPRRLVE